MPHFIPLFTVLFVATCASRALASPSYGIDFATEHHVDRTTSPVSDFWQLSISAGADTYAGQSPADLASITSPDGTLNAQFRTDGSGFSQIKTFSTFANLQTFLDAAPWNFTLTTAAGVAAYKLNPNISTLSESQLVTLLPATPTPGQIIITLHPTFTFPAIGSTRYGQVIIKTIDTGSPIQSSIQIFSTDTTWSPTVVNARTYDFAMYVGTYNADPIGTSAYLSGLDLGAPDLQFTVQSITDTPFTVSIPEPTFGAVSLAPLLLLRRRRRGN